LFIIGLKMLGRAESARRGNLMSALAMFIAVVATLFQAGVHYGWIVTGIVIGGAIGAFIARRVQMTQMPEVVALLNGSGGGASLLVGWVEYLGNPDAGSVTTISIFLAVLIGAVTLSGSIVAWAKLSERISGKPIMFGGQQLVNALIIGGALVLGVLFVIDPAGSYPLLLIAILLSLALG